jgi:hypothetical protein
MIAERISLVSFVLGIAITLLIKSRKEVKGYEIKEFKSLKKY